MSATEIVILHILFISGSMDCADLSITAPKEMEALSGSCLHIPCTFSATEEIKIDNRIGMWIKNTHEHLGEHPENVIFRSNNAGNIYPMNITGNLSENNCSTLFSSLNTSYTNKYFFRFKRKTFKGTASDDPIQITVKDSPRSPTIEMPGDLEEAESVTVTCSAPAPCPHSPPKLTWTLQQNPPNTMEENPDRTFTTKIQKTLTLTDQQDGFNITCSASYPVNQGKEVKTAEETMTLHVSYAPKDTSASVSRPSGSVSAGSWVKLSCSSRAQPPVSSFTWFKESQDGDMNVSQGETYSFNATEGGRYYCVATNEIGNGKSTTIHLKLKDENEMKPNSSPMEPAYQGVIVGIILLISLVVIVFALLRGKRGFWTCSTEQQSLNEELTIEEPAEEIHYGEIDFSKQTPGSTPVPVQDGGQKEETLYAQVNVPHTADSLTQAAKQPEDLYAQVKE
ncbi:hypothetical protein NQZ68_016098 [Dissostichus eleginoides]|nr:hypothetical protein NQZ68_016098 [Dissostichus eleginoides]